MSEAAHNTVSLAEAKRRLQMANRPIDDALPSAAEGVVPLGHDRGVYFYLSRATKQIAALKPDQHTRLALTGLASSAHYWERQGQFRTDKGIDWGAIADHLMSGCRAVGIYDPDIVRGRGAWLDAGRAVLHLGNKLIVDGAPSPLELAQSTFVYEAAAQLRLDAEVPLSFMDGRKLIKICEALRWQLPVSGRLLAGWIALAPICGALAWRPSVWLTGGAGSGKTWIGENIVSPVLGPLSVPVQSTTTEAGLRQVLGSDARPVVFDEAEREDHASAVRMQSVLGLVRQSTSESGAGIVKGSQNQSGARRYRVRSMFMFQSINVGLQFAADESRVTVLSLRDASKIPSVSDAQEFTDLRVWCAETLTKQFSAALVSRMVSMIPLIRTNAETFAQAISATLGTRRLGDQLGTLLAGWWALGSDDPISLATATKIVAREEFKESAAAEPERDEERCLHTILSYRVRMNHDECSIGRLVDAVTFDGISRPSGMPGQENAMQRLAEFGLKVGPRSRSDGRRGLFVSTRSTCEIKQALRDSPWSARWSDTLMRFQGACGGRDVQTRFSSNPSDKRGVWLPWDVVSGASEE